MNRKKSTVLKQQAPAEKNNLFQLHKRKSIRFPPDELAYASLDWKTNKETFTPTTLALLLNESYSGCALVLSCEKKPETGTKAKIKVGSIGPLWSEIIWVKKLDDGVYKVGIHFLE